jgi:uncharacterized membrane protein YphA (DoxX/SURF4 family)
MSDETRRKLGRILLVLGRLVLGGIFIYAAYTKMAPMQGMGWTIRSINNSLNWFANGVDSYQMLPNSAVEPFAHLLPPFELLLGLWLVSGLVLRWSGLVASGLVTAFIIAMFSAYLRGLTISCGCFGPGKQIGPQDLARDGLLFLPLALAVTIGGFMIRPKRGSASFSEVPASVTHAD